MQRLKAYLEPPCPMAKVCTRFEEDSMSHYRWPFWAVVPAAMLLPSGLQWERNN